MSDLASTTRISAELRVSLPTAKVIRAELAVRGPGAGAIRVETRVTTRSPPVTIPVVLMSPAPAD